MINLDLERGRADTHDDLFMSQNFLESFGCQQSQDGVATNRDIAQQMPSQNDYQHLSMEIPVNHQQSFTNLEEASFPNSSQSQYEEKKEDLQMSKYKRASERQKTLTTSRQSTCKK